MRPSNYHTHTTYCDGKNTPRELIEEAIRQGCPEIGFSGHSYIPFDPEGSMSPRVTEAYFRELSSLREDYKEKIRVLIGLEQDYFSPPPTLPFDYLIGSVHYIRVGEEYFPIDCGEDLLDAAVKKFYGGDYYRLAEDYYALVANLPEKTGCQIIGHFDLVMKYNEGGKLFSPEHPRYRAAAENALCRLLPFHPLLEINTGDVARGRRSEPYPSHALRKEAEKLGFSTLYSSDCHQKENLLFALPEGNRLIL